MQTVAEVLRPVVSSMLDSDDIPIAVEFWDGSRLGTAEGATRVTLRSPMALRRLLFAPGELGLARAYVAGDLDVEGDIFGLFALRDALAAPGDHLSIGFKDGARRSLLRAARQLGVLRRPPAPPREEARLSGRLHSRARDARAIAHHYDVSNEFYGLVLGDTMTYSCAYFPEEGMSLDDAQRAKHDLVCRKLGLQDGMRLLDVGCGWGELIMHAALNYGVSAVGVTVSRAQAELAEKRIAGAGVADRVEVRLQDYRDVGDGPYDAISSIGMFEHVGLSQLERYFSTLYQLLRPQGRLLNHAISHPRGNRGSFDKNSFVARYVFPDGELHEVGTVVSSMQQRGFEVRDVESLREHYARTLRLWVANLERHGEEAIREVGPGRTRVWHLYMAGSAAGFEAGRINVHQTLGVRTDGAGRSGMPRTRSQFIA